MRFRNLKQGNLRTEDSTCQTAKRLTKHPGNTLELGIDNRQSITYNVPMEYAMPITQKGQITLPKAVREMLGVSLGNKVLVSTNNKAVSLSRAHDLMDKAGYIKAPKSKRTIEGILKARELMEKTYVRV